MPLDPIELTVFASIFASVAEEMGVTLGRAAYSPNIKERRDYSCAVFDAEGRLAAQAAHIPVHLGAMPHAVRVARERHTFGAGDLVIFNDPYLGGTHLPDVTMVSPVFVELDGQEPREQLVGYLASRAHQADIGGMTAGSMPVSTELYQEGIIIPPLKVIDGGKTNQALLEMIYRNVRTPKERAGDFAAQMAAHRTGEERLRQVVVRYSLPKVQEALEAVMEYSEAATRALLRTIPAGSYDFEDCLDDDGVSDQPVPIKVRITIADGELTADFTGSAPECTGSVNAVLAVTQSATYYVVRCLTGEEVHVNDGCFRPVQVIAPEGSVLNPRPPRAVVGGNVETSQRVTDVLLGALAKALPDRIPAASYGTMSNVTIGGHDPFRDRPFAYYETIAGGAGGRSYRGWPFSGTRPHDQHAQYPRRGTRIHVPLPYRRVQHSARVRRRGPAARRRRHPAHVRIPQPLLSHPPHRPATFPTVRTPRRTDGSTRTEQPNAGRGSCRRRQTDAAEQNDHQHQYWRPARYRDPGRGRVGTNASIKVLDFVQFGGRARTELRTFRWEVPI